MKTSIYINFRSLLLLLISIVIGSCQDDESMDNLQGMVQFSSQTDNMEGVITRAGRTGSITDDVLQQSSVGFGVFAYHTAEQTWNSAATSLTPNFMYNQHVTYSQSDGQWKYAPMKYWPNDTSTGAVDVQEDNQGSNPATGSQDGGRVSFFAYAPYVDITADADPTNDAVPTADIATAPDSRTGIIALIGNAHIGTPQLEYRLDTDHSKQVDLLWGTRGSTAYIEANGSVDTNPAITNTDLRKQTTSERVKFAFKHALSSIDVYVQRIYDEISYSGKSPSTDAQRDKNITRIYVGKLELATSVPLTGRLDLSTGAWQNLTIATPVNITIDFGRIPSDLRGSILSNTSLGTIQSVELNDFTKKYGVNDTLKLLTETATTTLLLPQATGISVTPAITYSFVTQDDQLLTGLPDETGTHRYARIVNTITSATPVVIGSLKAGATSGSTDVNDYFIEQGKRYIIVCYIGTEHVSFRQVAVEDWDFPLRFHLESSSDYTEETKGKELNEK